MLLAVDIGNTQSSFGVFSAQGLTYHWRAETKASRTPDEYASLLFPLFQYAKVSPKDFDAVAICSVVPSADHSFEKFSKEYLSLPTFKVHCGLKLGCTLNVDFPSEVGADRLANAAFAVRHLKLPAIVIDLGTATTFDVVSAGAVYEGGLILPGLRVAVEALGSRTSKLPVVDLKFPSQVIGKNTAACIQSGILYGYCDLIDGLLARLIKEVKGQGSIALTGGIAPLLHKRLSHATDLFPNLTLEGVEILYRDNL